MTISEPRALTPGKSALLDPDLEDAIREYLRTYVMWRGIRQAAATFSVSRHTLWRFLRRGHTGRALPRAVMGIVGDSVEVLEAAIWDIVAPAERLVEAAIWDIVAAEAQLPNRSCHPIPSSPA